MSGPVESRHRVNGVELAVFEWPGQGPPLLFVHATGYHARVWDRVIASLPGRRALAVDMRGHGRSSKPAPPYPWRTFGEDVAALAARLELRGAVGVGHSMGGHSLTIAAALEPHRFGALLLVDPVIPERERYREAAAAPSERTHFASRRRNEFASPDEMFERFQDRAPFKSWDRRALRDYCEHGLLPAPGGEGYVLACPPAVEAAIYAGSAGADVYDEIAALTLPVRVLRSGAQRRGDAGGFGASPAAPDLASHFARGEDVYLPGNSHFVPMESPALVAEHVLAMAAKAE